MMNFDGRTGLISAFGLIAVFLGAALGAQAAAAQDWATRITELCLSEHPECEGCHCLTREAGSRFEQDHLQIIADAMEAGESASEIKARLLEQGMSEAEVASFAHRLDSAHIVIHQTCGASFFEPDAR